ncbi:hypothetical protein [uncultured Celeribacter sp.]|uniref:hypothetical protein n=1 Tax=uncultured Celeribacter sp. TaxID=1303376 RepID=UPI002AA66E0C|nr:hypothetical protein [uncultured Celeribacter sp.]
MTKDVEVTLITPAKVAGKRQPSGKTLTVSETVRDQLIAAGAVAKDAAPVTTISGDNDTAAFEAAVEAKAKEIAEAIVDAAVETAVTELQATADEATARAIEAEAQRDLLQERVLELQAQLDTDPAAGASEEATAAKDEAADESSEGDEIATKAAKGRKTSSAQKS